MQSSRRGIVSPMSFGVEAPLLIMVTGKAAEGAGGLQAPADPRGPRGRASKQGRRQKTAGALLTEQEVKE